MRPQLHHIDAIARNEHLSKRRVIADSQSAAEPQAVFDRFKSADAPDEPRSLETYLNKARNEQWKHLKLTEMESNEFFEHLDSLYVNDTGNTPNLASAKSNSQYMDDVSGRHVDRSTRHSRRGATKKQIKSGEQIEISDDSGDSDVQTTTF
jgi:hypothetical protein